MQNVPTGATGEAVPKPTLPEIIRAAEDDMCKVLDLALVVHNALNRHEPISVEMADALTWQTSELVKLGRRLAEIHDAMFEAARNASMAIAPAAEASATPAARAEVELDAILADLISVADCARDMLIEQSHIRRFLLHVLPRGFHRIRHYGFLTGRGRKAGLDRIRVLLGAPTMPRSAAEEKDVSEPPAYLPTCPCCGGTMNVVGIFLRWRQVRGPPAYPPPTRECSP